MNRTIAHDNRINDDAHHSHKCEALSLFLSDLFANTSSSKIEIVSDNAKKRVSSCKIQRQTSRISICRNQRWKCSGSTSGSSIGENNVTASSSRNIMMNDLPQRRKSFDGHDSMDSIFSWDFNLDDDDGISSTVSLEDSYRSCDDLGPQDHNIPITPFNSPVPTLLKVHKKYGSPTSPTRK